MSFGGQAQDLEVFFPLGPTVLWWGKTRAVNAAVIAKCTLPQDSLIRDFSALDRNIYLLRGTGLHKHLCLFS